MASRLTFDGFVLDPDDRRLTHDGAAVDLNARYFDALVLLAVQPGALVTKDRLLDEVWRGVPVTDEALTQCIKTLRRALGDNAAHPQFIETVPKHGYRFIAAVERERGKALPTARSWQRFVLLGLGGTVGGGIAGLVGGLVYGFAAGSGALEPGVGGGSVFMVLVCLCIVVGLLGGAGVSFGIAAAELIAQRAWKWSAAGAALGGMFVGGFVKLLGLDAFNLLIGQSPGNITGALEGLILGAAVGLGLWLGSRSGAPMLRYSAVAAGLAGAAAGAAMPLFGGRLMAGSLDLLARQFPESRLELGQIGHLLGEDRFGPLSQTVTGGLEGLLFGFCTTGAIVLAHRDLDRPR